MKNRKTVVVAFLLVAVMLMGVGYAALSDSLRIDGTAHVKHENANNAFDGVIKFDTNITNGKNQADTVEYSADADIATVKVNSLTVEGSTAVFHLKIVNGYQENVYVTPTIDESSALYDKTLISLSSNWKSQTHEIAAESEIEYVLTVTCLRTVANDEETSFAIGFAVTDVPPENFVAFGQEAQSKT